MSQIKVIQQINKNNKNMKDLTNKRIARRKYNSTLETEGKISGTQELFTPEK